MDQFSVTFLLVLASFLVGVFVGAKNSREHYEQKALDNERFWLNVRDEWHKYYTQNAGNTLTPTPLKFIHPECEIHVGG